MFPETWDLLTSWPFLMEVALGSINKSFLHRKWSILNTIWHLFNVSLILKNISGNILWLYISVPEHTRLSLNSLVHRWRCIETSGADSATLPSFNFLSGATRQNKGYQRLQKTKIVKSPCFPLYQSVKWRILLPDSNRYFFYILLIFQVFYKAWDL